MSNFFTETEKSFNHFMNSKGYVCDKIEENNIEKVPDFLCKLGKCEVIFELKDLRESGTAEYEKHIYSQKINIKKVIIHILAQSVYKFNNLYYKEKNSALVITCLRPHIDFANTLMPEVKNIVKSELYKYPEIGNVILLGYNKPGNRILALHVFENKNSKRIIDKSFFTKLNHKYYN